LQMTGHFNDSPIETAEQDTFGVAHFALAIARSIANIKDPIGSTIAIQGSWGAGKSSAINLIRTELDGANSESIIVAEFKCWWFRGDEALALAFLQTVHGAIAPTLGEAAGKAFKSLTKRLFQAGPVIGAGLTATGNPVLGSITGSATKYLDGLFSGGDSLEKVHSKLSRLLSQQKKRFLIIIDDLDRLKPDEMIAILQMVKSVGRLPNVIYLLSFDRNLLESAVDKLCPSEGPHFLEKIVQAALIALRRRAVWRGLVI
jgi:predicted KAP-like P-loop ATPase